MTNFTHRAGNAFPPGRQAGLSLVELMISLTIGLILLAGITALITRQSGTRSELEKSSRQIENGRYAMEILHGDIELAGLYGEYSPPLATTYTIPADPCDMAEANQGWDSATQSVPVPIYGYTGAAPAPGCVANRLAGTSMLVVRRTATPAVDAGAAVAGTTYLQVSRCNTDTSVFAFGTGGFNLKRKDCATPAPLHKYIVRIYYISSCSICSGSADSIPTLKMVEFIDGAQAVIPLVEGIENMQFDYGIAASATSGSPAAYTTAPAAGDWANVMAVRVNLLVRNNDPSPGYTDTKSYTLGGAGTVTPGGPYMRHLYSQVVRAANPSGRRE